MAERPLGFARRMMAQQLMTDALGNEFSDSPFFAGKVRPSMADIERPTTAADMYPTAATGSLFLPGAGVADVLGQAPDPARPGQTLPSFGQNIAEGKFLDAGLQTAGAAGDVLLAMSPVLPPAAAVGTALKAPRAAKVGRAVDAAQADPNQAAGAAMDAAQARYFETGNFEPPTAENPVSIVPPKPDEPGIIAFHGSGADFDEFRLEMIGTGEGAQAYGYGLYFTDSEDIAKFYRDTVGAENLVLPSGNTVRTYSMGDMAVVEDALPNELEQLGVINQAPDGTAKYNKPSVLIAEAIGEAGSDDLVGNARKYLETKLETESSFERQKLGFTKAEGDALEQANINALTAFDKMIEAGIETKRGKMYKVGLAPKPDELVDYDLSLNQQPEKIKKVLQPFYEKYGVANTADFGTLLSSVQSSRTIPDDAFAEKLVEAGIPGIKYRAAGSRGAAPTGSVDKILVNGEKFESKDKLEKIAIHTLALRSNRIAGVMQSVKDEKLSKADKNKVVEIAQKFLDDGKKATFKRESNYVIFDDKAVKILEKYGIVGPVAVAAVAGTQRGDNDNEGSIFADAGGI